MENTIRINSNIGIRTISKIVLIKLKIKRKINSKRLKS